MDNASADGVSLDGNSTKYLLVHDPLVNFLANVFKPIVTLCKIVALGRLSISACWITFLCTGLLEAQKRLVRCRN